MVLLDTLLFTEIVNTVYNWVWSPVLVGLCLLLAFYYTFRTRFVQLRRIGDMCRMLFSTDDSQKTGVTSFQAFSMALSGRVGTGNIVGVATAIGFGGPGAIVWMWVIAFFGAGTAFVEATLAQIFKESHNGELRGGPAYYIEKGLHSTIFGCIFAVITAVASGLFLPPVQSNGIALSMSQAFGINTWVAGLVVAFLIGLLIIGGVKRIAKVAEVITPFMAIFYILLSLVVLAVHYQMIPHVFHEMLRNAVGAGPLGSAILGTAISWGVKRGLYSNEAGQGSGAIMAAPAKVDHPVKQGLVQAFSVYIDTLLVCTATAVMILACQTYNIIDHVQETETGQTTVTYLQQNPDAPIGEPGVFYTIDAVATLVGHKAATALIAIALFFFAFTTIMAYYYYAETNLVYLFSRFRRRRLQRLQKKEHDLEKIEREKAKIELSDSALGGSRGEKIVVGILRVTLIVSVFLGTIGDSDAMWSIGDIGVGAMTWINLIAIFLLSSKALRALRDYEQAREKGEEPHFDPKKLDIEGAEFWETLNG